MEQNSNSRSLEVKHISHSANEIVSYIDNRRKGKSYSLRTKWPKLNRLCMGGLEPNTIYSIVGMSGFLIMA